MQTWISLSTFFFFGVRISINDLLLRKIRNVDLGYFVSASILANFEELSNFEYESLFCTLITCISLYAFSGGRIGAGDLKLLAAMSIWRLDFLDWLYSFGLSWILGGIVALVLMLAKRANSGSIAFGPMIFFGFAIGR